LIVVAEDRSGAVVWGRGTGLDARIVIGPPATGVANAGAGDVAKVPRTIATTRAPATATALGSAMRPRSATPRLTGSSTAKYETVAHASVTATRARSRVTPSRCVRFGVRTSCTGQCHRYRPYEIVPIHTRGLSDRIARTGPRGCPAAAMTIAT